MNEIKAGDGNGDAGRTRKLFYFAGVVNLGLGIAGLLACILADFPLALLIVAIPGSLIVLYTGIRLLRAGRGL